MSVRVTESVKALEMCQSVALPSFDIYDNIYDINQNVMSLAAMSAAQTNGGTALLAPPTNGGTAPVSLVFNNHINTLIGQVTLRYLLRMVFGFILGQTVWSVELLMYDACLLFIPILWNKLLVLSNIYCGAFRRCLKKIEKPFMQC